MDEVWILVERAIGIADVVDAREPDQRGTARRALVELAETLRESAPHHPALRRLDEYIEDFGP